MPNNPGQGKPPKAPRVNVKDVKKLIDMMRKAELAEINIEQEGLKIMLKKGSEAVVSSGSAPAPLAPIVYAPAAPAAPQAPQAPSEAPKAAEAEGQKINSPMVGTFYRSASPDAEFFVKEGSRVEIGQTICIIEAMKLMNEIKAEVAGTVVRVLIENAQPVEYGQPLFIVKP